MHGFLEIQNLLKRLPDKLSKIRNAGRQADTWVLVKSLSAILAKGRRELTIDCESGRRVSKKSMKLQCRRFGT